MRDEQQRLARLGASRPAGDSTAEPADAHQPQAADADGSAPAQLADDASGTAERGTESLLQLAAKSRKEKPEETEAEKALKEEQELLKATTQQKALQGVQELARVRARFPVLLTAPRPFATAGRQMAGCCTRCRVAILSIALCPCVRLPPCSTFQHFLPVSIVIDQTAVYCAGRGVHEVVADGVEAEGQVPGDARGGAPGLPRQVPHHL